VKNETAPPKTELPDATGSDGEAHEDLRPVLRLFCSANV